MFAVVDGVVGVGDVNAAGAQDSVYPGFMFWNRENWIFSIQRNLFGIDVSWWTSGKDTGFKQDSGFEFISSKRKILSKDQVD